MERTLAVATGGHRRNILETVGDIDAGGVYPPNPDVIKADYLGELIWKLMHTPVLYNRVDI